MSINDQTLEELQNFCEAQQKVIIQLNKKIQKIEAEKNHLEELIKKSPVTLFGDKIGIVDPNQATEEAICVMQIKRLEEISLGRELTLEETRKLEAFSKILATFRNGSKSIENKTKNIPTADLLKLKVVDENGDKS